MLKVYQMATSKTWDHYQSKVLSNLKALPEALDVEKNIILPIVQKCFLELEPIVHAEEGSEKEGKWQFTEERNGVKLYKKHNDDTPIKAVKGVCLLEGYTITQIFEYAN